jgi:hypothetical protein
VPLPNNRKSPIALGRTEAMDDGAPTSRRTKANSAQINGATAGANGLPPAGCAIKDETSPAAALATTTGALSRARDTTGTLNPAAEAGNGT